MLTSELAIVRYDDESGRVFPDRLTRGRDRRYVAVAARLLAIYRRGIGRARDELHREARDAFAGLADCPPRRVQAFCKLLDDAAEFDSDARGAAAKLRQEVFRLAAGRHPLVGPREADAKRRIAARLGRPWEEIDRALFADVIQFQPLRSFPGYASPKALLARYNVAQTQAAMYRAAWMTVWADADFKTILRYAKLAGLMAEIERLGPQTYRFRFDGPASVLRPTPRYGAAMARFLPALIACGSWRLVAAVRGPRRQTLLRLELSSADGLTSHLPPPEEFDSRVERKFAEAWGDAPREGWRLVREGEILHCGQKVFAPDFAFRHTDGRTALLEIVGFWTPEYLRAKAETLRLFRDRRILVAVSHRVRHRLPPLPVRPIVYESALGADDVLAALSEAPRRK